MNAAAGRPAERVRPRAHCTADSAGGLTFDVALGVAHDDAAGRWDTGLLLRRRPASGRGAAEEVRLPLVPTSPGVLRAALPSTMPLAEGVWHAWFSDGERRRSRLLPGTHDLRSLVDRRPRPDRTWLGVRIPCTTTGGTLAVRAWQRWPHAEAADVKLADGVLTLRGQLYGAELGEGARVEVGPPDAGAAPEPLVAVPAEPDGAWFTARLPLAALPARAESECAVWLRPARAGAPVRVARILDDVADKRTHVRFPAVRLADGRCRVRPCYSQANELLLRFEQPRAAR
ncbi:hypothetical protein JJV70_08905 [Streptomyces sp. JJ66]|uniref:hypothetical protein n=1 Tax=Streptomyces sp. JJ66 TaxID=2803843 RepID=UPI001C56AB3A|nr:hypothetical protein [Streptomyces sp. JJ66]MBW1602228.1 hypothetical protein [Streptomyces sp. JJ66]